MTTSSDDNSSFAVFTSLFGQNTPKPKIYKSEHSRFKFIRKRFYLMLSLAISIVLYLLFQPPNTVPSTSNPPTPQKPKHTQNTSFGTASTQNDNLDSCRDETPKYGGTMAWSCDDEMESSWNEYFNNSETLSMLIESFSLNRYSVDSQIYYRIGRIDSKERELKVDLSSSILTDTYSSAHQGSHTQ